MGGGAVASKRLPRKPNVLAVDDKRANLIALEATLASECNILFAHSGRDAIALLERDPSAVDLILMDIHMPDMDGFEATAQIKKMPGCEDIPVIFITAVFNEDPFVKRGYQAGGIDYFTKPFDPDILRMKIAVYASYRLQDELLKARERSVKESEELLRVGRKLSLLLESLPIGVLISDVEGRICQTTEEVARILGSTVPAQDDSYGEILGWWDASGRMIKDWTGPLARAIRRGERSHSEPLQIRCVDGMAKTILVSASPLRGLDAHIVGAVVLIQDLTESKKVIEEELEQRIAGLLSLGVELEESVVR
jgi:CheY-like chemotaxis protein